jgi:hypothetical protein
VCSIECTQDIPKIWPPFRIVSDSLWNGIIGSRQAYISVVEFTATKDVEDLSKVPSKTN